MSKNLVIVESPAKAKTLGQFLGSDYTVKASLGHVRDLPEKEIGIDVENDFAPTYVVVKGKTKVLKEIKDGAKTAKAVYLATDPDREGEAISWHLIEAAGLGKKQLKRVVFHEITKEAILDAFKHPRTIDLKLVNAQQARRILDRLVGYKLSPLLWKKVRRGLSAGRVQSVAVKLIVDREAEILAFVPVEYWSIEAELSQEGKKSSFRANLVGPVNGDKIELKDKEQTDKLVAKLEKASYAASGVRQKQTSASRRRRSSPARCSRRPGASSDSAASRPWPSHSSFTRACPWAKRGRWVSSPTCVQIPRTSRRPLWRRHGTISPRNTAKSTCRPRRGVSPRRSKEHKRLTRRYALPRCAGNRMPSTNI